VKVRNLLRQPFWKHMQKVRFSTLNVFNHSYLLTFYLDYNNILVICMKVCRVHSFPKLDAILFLKYVPNVV
jgi:hypothetical protein